MTLASAACTLSVGLALASAVLVVYLCHLIRHGIPPGGMGALSACVAALLLGEAARELLPVDGSTAPFLGSPHAGSKM